MGSNALSEGFEYPLHETRVEVGRLPDGRATRTTCSPVGAFSKRPGFFFSALDSGDREKNTYACEPGSETTFSTARRRNSDNTGYRAASCSPTAGIQTIDSQMDALGTEDRVCTCSADRLWSAAIRTRSCSGSEFDVSLDVPLYAAKETSNGSMCFFGARLTVHLTAQVARCFSSGSR